jgi:hypothetical protein
MTIATLRAGRRTLAGVHRGWGALNAAQGAWLIKQGVSVEAILEPDPIGTAWVRFNDGTFEVAETGIGALTFRIRDVDGAVIDLAAWSPRTGDIGCWYGRGFALGQEQIDNPATYFAADALRVHATPLDWLLADRAGICIVQPNLTYAMLRFVERVSFADFAFATKFETWIQPPRPRVAMFVEGYSHD